MAADEVAPARAVWRLGDYHRFAREQMWEIGPVIVAACGISPGQRVLDVAVLTPLGRQEWEDSPEGYPQTPPYEWWRRHDEYGDGSGTTA